MTASNFNSSDLVLLGVPFDEKASLGLGSRFAPKVIRELSSQIPPYTMDRISLKNFNIHDFGDTTCFKEAMDLVMKALRKQKFILTLGGDHSISIYLQKAFYNYAKSKNLIPVLIHIDAHPDLCDIYDNQLDSHATTVRRAIDNGYNIEDIILIGIRGYEEEEVAFLEKNKELKVFDSNFLNNYGFLELLNYLKNKYNDKKYIIYLSYDIDANDPGFAPGTGTPEAFGLNNKLLLDFIKEIMYSLPILAMDIVEVSPPLDVNNITSWLAVKTMYEIFKIIEDKKNETHNSGLL